MKENEHMDKWIADKAKSFEKAPPPEIWDNILLGIQPRKKFLLPVFWRYAATIAILISIGTGFFYIFRNTENEIPLQLTSEQPESRTKKPETEKNIAETKKEVTSAFNENVSGKTLKTERAKYSPNENSTRLSSLSDKNSELINTETSGSVNSLSNNNSTILAGLMTRLPLQINPGEAKPDIINKAKREREYSWDDLAIQYNEDAEKQKEMSVSAMLSPIYSYRDLESSGLNQIFNSVEKGKFSYSGGMQMGFNASDRMSFSTGLIYSKLGYSVQGVTNTASPGNINWLSTKSALPGYSQDLVVSNSIGAIVGQGQGENQSDRISSADNSNASFDFVNAGALNSSSGQAPGNGLSLDQIFQVMEIPFIVRYKIIDRAIDFKIIGGLSTNFLIGNKVVLYEGNASEYLGPTEDIKKVNYAGNVGFGIDYNLRENMVLLFEPQFKYYLNSINESYLIGTRPYSFGFYTGLRYFFR